MMILPSFAATTTVATATATAATPTRFLLPPNLHSPIGEKYYIGQSYAALLIQILLLVLAVSIHAASNKFRGSLLFAIAP